MEKMSRRKKVLILAGGGYFGLTISSFLSFLGEEKVPAQVDSISGTSIGGILTCALMAGTSNQEILDGFIQSGEKIFSKRWQAKLCPLSIPFYSNSGLKEVVSSFVGSLTIADTRKLFPGTSMFVPALNLTQNKLKVWDNVDGKDDPYSLLSVSLYTSAAPFYFPVLEDRGDAITDGGVREVCPVLTTACGLKKKLGLSFEEMDVFCMGVGESIDSSERGAGTYAEISKWSALDWATKFIVPDVTCSNLSTSRFWGENLGFGGWEWFDPIKIASSLDDVSTKDSILRETSMYKEEFLDRWHSWLNRD